MRAFMAAQHYDICIRGAGIVGRTLALLLARQRLRVALLAAPGPAPASDVRAYAISPAAQALLQDLRCWPEEPASTPVLSMRVEGDRQSVVRFSAAEQAVPALNWIVDVPALEQRLADACGYQSDIDLVSEPAAAPLTVVCEGRASATRAELGVPFESTPYPQHAIATRLSCEHPHGQQAWQWFSPTGEVLAFLPLGGPQGHEVAVVWSVRSERLPERMAMDEDAFAQALGEASAHALGALRLIAPRASWPLILARATRWVGHMPGQPGRSFALAGDAAHAMHPLAGQGLNVGLGDAAQLARVLAEREYWRPLSDLKPLRRYERARQGEWLRMRLATDGLQLLFNQPAGWAALARNWGMTLFEASGPLKARVARLAMGVG